MAEFSPSQTRIDTTGQPGPFQAPKHEVEALIGAARQHPLGTEFLIDGHLEAVAVTFQVHAFTVDAARRVLRGE